MAALPRRKNSFRFHLKPSTAAIMMAFAVPAAYGQTTDEKALPEVEVTSTSSQKSEGFRTDSTSSATRTDTPLRDIPQYINSVPQAVIQSQGATTLQDALRNVPGITYAAPEGGTQANQLFYLRGFPAGGDLFIDGVRDIGEYNRDLFDTESVEVLKGPSALMFGRGSTGGVINQVSKVPMLDSLKQVGVSFGSNGEKRATADVNLRIGETSAVRLGVMGEDSDSYRDTIEVRKLGFAPSLKLGIGTPTEITLSYYYLKTSDVTDYGQPTLGATKEFGMPPVPLSNYYGYANYDFTDHETNIATFRIDHRFSEDVSLRNTLRAASYQRDMEATIAQSLNDSATGKAATASTPMERLLAVRQHNKSRDNDDTALINQTELTWKIQTGAIKHTVLTGLELSKEDLYRTNYNFDADPNTAGVQAPSSSTPLLAPSPYDSLSYTKAPNQIATAEATGAALFVQDQVEFSPQWKALIGLRYDYYDVDVATATVATGAIVPLSQTDKMVSGRAGLIWQPSDAQSYYLSAGNSYNPSGELGVYGATGTNLTAASLNIDPEENWSYEIGSQWDFATGFQVRAAIFRNEKTNARMADPLSGLTVLEGKRRVDGVELSATGRIGRNWDVYSSLAYMDGEIVEAATNQGNVPLGVPTWSGTVWTVYRLGGGWQVGGGTFASTPWWLDDGNRGRAPGYMRWDTMVGYVQKKYDIQLNIFNIFDEVYYIGGYQNNPNRVLPGQPRTAMLSANYRFD